MMDATFAIFRNDCQKDSFFEKLNNMHANLKFTIENAVDNKLAFLDFLVHPINKNFIEASIEKLHLLVTISRSVYYYF